MDNMIAMACKVRFPVLIIILASVCQAQFIPRPPTDVQISDITGSSLRLSWSPNPGSENILHYIIKYRPKTSNQGHSEISGITANTYTMRDLSPYTEYEFSVIAVNSAGRGAPSTPVVAPFLRGDPGSPPVNVRGRPLTSTSVFIQWDPPKEFVGQIMAYKVYHTANLGPEFSKWDTQLVGNNRLTTISNLAHRTVYAIMVQAFTIHGYGPHSHPIQVKTQKGVPSQPARIVVTDISFTSVLLYWSKPALDGDSITGYELYWNDSQTDQQYHKSLNDTDSHTIRGLHPDTLYRVWVAAKSEHGEGAPTYPVQVRTDRYVPNKPRKLAVRPINTSAIIITWRHPLNKDRRGLIEGYHIYLKEVSNTKDVTNEPKRYFVADESAVEYNISDLQPSTQYSVQVAAVTREGDGPLTKEKTTRTPGGVPTRPELRVRLTQGERHFVVEISWHPPLHVNGNLRNYRLIHGRSDLLEKSEMVVQELDPRTEKQTIHYLNYGAPYIFYLSAKNDNGWGQEAVAHLLTPEAAPLAAPQNLTHRLQSPSSVVVTWLPPPLQYRNGEIIRYGILLHKVLDEKTIERKTSGTRMVFSGLSEGTEYNARVRAYTAMGAGPWSSRISVITPQYVLPAPTDILVGAASEQSVEVSWKWDPAPYLVDTLGFQVMYTTDPVEDLDEWSHKTVPFTFSAELKGLEMHASYAIRLAVVTVDGLGRLSDIEIVKVDPTDVPNDLSAKDITTMSMTLSWRRPSKLEPIKYQISYDAYKEFYDADGKLQKLSVPRYVILLGSHVTDYALHDLMPFTSYNVNVTAIAPDKQPRPPAKIIVTTAMAAPKPMAKPGIVGFGGEISIILPKVSEEHGPTSNYDLVVVPEEYARRDPGDYLTGELEAVPLDKIGPYITARFYGSMPVKFPLGDSEVYGSFVNRRLQHDGEYRVFARAVVDSPLKNLYTSSPLSDLISWDITYPPEKIMNIDYGYDIPGYGSEVCIPSGAERVVFTWTLRILEFFALLL